MYNFLKKIMYSSVALLFLLMSLVQVTNFSKVYAKDEDSGEVATPPAPIYLKKEYNLENAGFKSPEENFSFEVEKVSTDATTYSDGTPIDKADMPDVTIDSVSYGAGDAGDTAKKVKNIRVVLPTVSDFDDIDSDYGTYIYNIREVNSNIAGVTYRSEPIKLKVIFYDDGDEGAVTGFFYNGDDKIEKFSDNTYSAGNLKITKEISGNVASEKKKFDFNVVLKAPKGKTVKSEIKYKVITADTSDTEEEKTISAEQLKKMSEDGGLTITEKLSGGDYIQFTNLPYGVTYSVTENSDDYVSNLKDGSTGTIDKEETTVDFTNTKNVEVNTGVFTDNLPYFALLGFVAVGAVLVFVKKRHSYED